MLLIEGDNTMAMAYSWESFIRIHGGEPGARFMFEKAMDELLRTENPDKEVHIVKDVQGDGGIDVLVYQNEGIDIYQCKFFMGSMDSSRWFQIKTSFKRAVEYMNSDKTKGVKMLRWFLCMPREMQKEDIAKWDTFRKANVGVEIKFIDGNEIINRMQNCDRQIGTNIIERYFYVSKRDIVLSDSEYVISEFEYNTSSNNQPQKELKKGPDVLIMVATKDEETAITSEKGWISRKTDDGCVYFEKKDGLTFALARSSSMGPDKAAQSAQYYYSKINPKYLAMAGFCAGREKKVNLGDVIVPYKMIKFGEGAHSSYNELYRVLTVYNLKPLWKQKAENFTSNWQKKIGINQPHSYKYQMYYFMKLFFEREGIVPTTDFLNNEDIPDYRDIIKQEVARGNVSIAMPDILLTEQGNQNYQEALFMGYQAENGLYHDPTPSIRVGIIATGQTVQKWDGIFDQLEKDYDRKIYALDMEATSIADVGVFNNIDYIIAKGVGDFATGNKTFDNHYMKYAIRASYHFIVDFFNSL